MRKDRAFVRDMTIAGAMLLCLIVGCIIHAARGPAPKEETPVAAEQPTNLDGEVQEPIEVAARPERKSPRQTVLDEIAAHKEKIALDPKDEDVPAYKLAIANLYVGKLGDHMSASVELEELISQFPDSDLTAQAYTKLARCYEKIGWPDVATATYRKMMRHFPEDSPSHEYARAKRYGTEGVH